jgi:REP element-mobilizing transposase RayT
MGRQLRPNLPGAFFHLSARCQGKEALFTPELRTQLVTLLRECVAFGDAQVIAYVVMPNHLHLVLRQGKAPLGRLMQPLLRRVALAALRAYGREGHVFERRYRLRLCTTAEYLRNAIVYTHLNPVRAGLCTRPEDYPWSSHAAWLGEERAVDGGPHPVMLGHAPLVFATGAFRTAGELVCDYLAFLEWRERSDQLRRCGGSSVGIAPQEEPLRPLVEHGDLNWAQLLATPEVSRAAEAFPDLIDVSGVRASRPELSAIARAVLREEGARLRPEWVRSRWGGPAYVKARHAIIRRAAAAGYRAREIAAYLRVSPTTVSNILTAERKRLLTT